MGNTESTDMEALVAEASAALGDDTPLVGDATPAAEAPSAVAPQATPPQDAPPQAKAAWSYEDFAARYESDPDFRRVVDKQHIEVRANSLFQRQRDREAKASRKAQLATAVEDPVRALDLAKTELDALEAEESRATQTATAVQRELERIASDEDDGAYYAELYRREGETKLNARLTEDAQAGLRWIKKEVRRLAVEAEAKKVTPQLAEAMAEHKSNQTLAALPVPPTASTAAGLSDQDFLLAYSRGDTNDHTRAAKLLGI